MNNGKHISGWTLSFFILLFTVSPLFTAKVNAYSLPNVKDALKGVLSKEQVPTNDSIQNLILTVLNVAARATARNMVERIVNSTITWANNGFDGSPAFVTDPAGYFGNIAESTAVQYINTVAGGNLCTPFRPQITLALNQYYADYYRNGSYYGQCTFGGIGNNLENFFNDFQSGGWQSWFSLTQNSSNNPYEAYLSAQIGLDSAIAQKVGVEQKKIDWGQGFKTKGDCLAWNPDEQEISNAEEAGEELPGYDKSYDAGACIKWEDVTPGSVIKSGVDKALGSGQDSLINAKQFDELISALLSNLTQKYVFGPEGLIRKTFKKDLPQGDEKADTVGEESYTSDPSEEAPHVPTPPSPPTETPGASSLLSCSPDKNTDTVNSIGGTTWTAEGPLVEAGLEQISWTWYGDDITFQSHGPSISVAYFSPGVKSASVSFTFYPDGIVWPQTFYPSGEVQPQTVSVPCSHSVIVPQGV